MSNQYHDLSVTEEIDGITYTSTKFPAMRGLGLMGRTAEALGEHGLRAVVLAKVGTVGKILGEVVSGSLVGRSAVAGAIHLAKALGEDPALAKDLCTNLRFVPPGRQASEGGPVPFDSHFAGEYVHLANVVAFVLRHNFMGFTRGSLSISGSRTTDEIAEDEPSNSPTPSAG